MLKSFSYDRCPDCGGYPTIEWDRWSISIWCCYDYAPDGIGGYLVSVMGPNHGESWDEFRERACRRWNEEVEMAREEEAERLAEQLRLDGDEGWDR